jgi:glutamate synthase domain-containing protein 2
MFAWFSKLDGTLPMRYCVWFACAVGLVGSVWLELTLLPRQEWLWLLPLIFGALVLTGWHDIRQERHAILRNYPVIGHLRFMLEFIRPEIRQYFIEADDERMPFSRQQRSLVYQRAKNEPDKRPFGTQKDVHATGYEWINHSLAPDQLEYVIQQVRIQ